MMEALAFLFLVSISFSECAVQQGMVQEVWPIEGQDATTASRSLSDNDIKPTQVSDIDNFDAAAKNNDPFGQRVKGFFTAPQTGEYKFYSSCTGVCDIYLSLAGKGASTNPDQKSKIISQTQETLHNEFDKYPEQVSHAVYLDKDKSYYMEGVEKQSQGLGLLSVGVVLPDDTKVFPIRKTYLSAGPPVEQTDEPESGQVVADKVVSIQQRKYGTTATRKRDSLYQRLQKINEFIKHLQDEAKHNETSEAELLKEAEKAEENAAKDDGSADEGTFLDLKGEHFADQDSVEPGINIYVGNGENQSEITKANSKPADFSKIDDRIFSNDKPKASYNMVSLKTGKPEVDKAEMRIPPTPTIMALVSKKSEGQPQPSNTGQDGQVSDAMYNSLMNLLKEEIAKSANAKAAPLRTTRPTYSNPLSILEARVAINKIRGKGNGTTNVTSPSAKATNVSATMVQNILDLFKSQQENNPDNKSNSTLTGNSLAEFLQGLNKGEVGTAKDEISKTNPVVKMMATMRPDDLQALFQLNDEINNLRTILAYKTVKSIRTEKTVRYPDHHEEYFHDDVHFHEDVPGLTDGAMPPLTPPMLLKKGKTSKSKSDAQDVGSRKSFDNVASPRAIRIHKEDQDVGGPQIVKVDFSHPDKKKEKEDSEEEYGAHTSPTKPPDQLMSTMEPQDGDPKKEEEKHEQGEQSQFVPPASMLGLNVQLDSEHTTPPIAEAFHSPHHDIDEHHEIDEHYPDYHEHHDKGGTVVSQTSVVQETSKLLMAPQHGVGNIDPTKIQNLMNEIGGLRKGVIGKDSIHPAPKTYPYPKGRTLADIAAESGNKRAFIRGAISKRHKKASKRHRKSEKHKKFT